MRRATCVAVFSLFITSCGPTTMDRLDQVPDHGSRDDVIAILGAPPPEADWPFGADKVPDGCTSQLVYKDEYRREYARTIKSKLPPAHETWWHLCFDADGKYMKGRHAFTLVDY